MLEAGLYLQMKPWLVLGAGVGVLGTLRLCLMALPQQGVQKQPSPVLQAWGHKVT